MQNFCRRRVRYAASDRGPQASTGALQKAVLVQPAGMADVAACRGSEAKAAHAGTSIRPLTTEGGADYVAPEDRIATFDQDGTL